MSSSRLVLVADDQPLATVLHSFLTKQLGHPPLAHFFTGVRDELGPDPGGFFVLACASAEDAKEAARLVQELRLLQWPATLIIVESEPLPPESELAALDPYVAGRLRWPEQAPALLGMLKDSLGRRRRPMAAQEPSLEAQIIRRLMGHTPSLLLLAEPLALAASHDVTVLLAGETGTGKTHLARLIHQYSPRRQERLLVVPCGALVANLVESELFGHARGAFTGADRPKTGKFEAVGEGTLLLDEINTLGLEQQANLLRVIETGEYEPVGSNETRICRARMIVASNCNLEEAVEQGKFRQDLFYRLNVMSFYLPPLRERVDDIAPLARGMIARFAQKFRKPLFSIRSDVISALEAFPWPGNIRQLENAMQQAVLLSTGAELLIQHLPRPIHEYGCPSNGHVYTNGASLTQNREFLERNVIQRALVSNSYNRARAAQSLGISRVTLYKKMRKYGLMEVPVMAAHAG